MRRFVRHLRGAPPAEALPIIVTAPGEEGQVDYGDGPMVRHPSPKPEDMNLFLKKPR